MDQGGQGGDEYKQRRELCHAHAASEYQAAVIPSERLDEEPGHAVEDQEPHEDLPLEPFPGRKRKEERKDHKTAQ